MTILTKIVHHLHKIAHIIENPKLLLLRWKGGSISRFISLNQPWLRELNIATVLDIGAYTGGSAIIIHAIFPNAKIYSFEPLPSCFEKLQMRMARVKSFTGFNIAIGELAGNLMIECNDFTPSSSLLKMTNLHKTEFPHTCESKAFRVKVERLDSIAEQLTITDPLWIKIDVQGYENKVLQGGERTIKKAKIIVIETSFKKLYKGQSLFDDIYRQLTHWGFTYMGAIEQLRSHKSGQLLQEDSIFIKY